MTILTVPQKNQKKVAIQTLKMTDLGVSLMGGMSKSQARQFLRLCGNSEKYIKNIEK